MNNDAKILKELGEKIAEIAHLPVQNEKRELWRKNNDLDPVRPMVYIDQLPWHELGKSDELKNQCEDEFLRSIETELLRTLYRWKHFPCDMVVENRLDIPHEIQNLNYGIHILEDVRQTDASNDIVSHKYADQIDTPEKLEALQADKIWVDRKLDEEHFERCSEIFDGILPVRFAGVQIHAGVWDRIAQMKPAEAILWDIIDRPDFVKDIVKKFVDLTIATLDQCEEQGLLDPLAQYVHCTGAYTDDLPKSQGANVTAKNVWAFGMAQIFSTVSPDMHDEFEIELVRPLYERFGLLYYGCCEPLEDKIDIIRKLDNVRKISVSPWADAEKSAERMGKDYVMSFKSNPSYIATGEFDDACVKKNIRDAVRAAKGNNTPVEIILKDVSTVSYHLSHIDRWEKTAMEIVTEG